MRTSPRFSLAVLIAGLTLTSCSEPPAAPPLEPRRDTLQTRERSGLSPRQADVEFYRQVTHTPQRTFVFDRANALFRRVGVCEFLSAGDVFMNGYSARVARSGGDTSYGADERAGVRFNGTPNVFQITGGHGFPAAEDSIAGPFAPVIIKGPRPYDTVSRSEELEVRWEPGEPGRVVTARVGVGMQMYEYTVRDTGYWRVPADKIARLPDGVVWISVQRSVSRLVDVQRVHRLLMTVRSVEFLPVVLVE